LHKFKELGLAPDIGIDFREPVYVPLQLSYWEMPMISSVISTVCPLTPIFWLPTSVFFTSRRQCYLVSAGRPEVGP